MWHLVSDTSSDLYTVEGGEGVFDFATIPFSIRIGGKEYMDDENINIDEMLTANENHAEQAQTSCPSPEEFGEKFRAPGPVIAFTISSALSGTYNSACIARDMILEEEPDKQIAVIDTKGTGPKTVLLIRACRKHETEGSLTVAFLLLFGAASIILESLRYDFFLSISFVGLQQVAAALTLGLGVILAVKRSNRPKSGLAIAAYISLPLMVGAVIGLEFALDRTNWNKFLVYALMIITVSIPAVLGMKLLGKGSKDRE